MVLIRAIIIITIIIIIGSTSLDGYWLPQGYYEAVCISAIIILAQVHTKIYTYTPYVGADISLMIVTTLCCFSVSLDNDQLDAHLLCFTIRPLKSSTCLEPYMLIIRSLNSIDAASGIVFSVAVRYTPTHRTATE